jgi:Reverse transcriptase (RNA-dependent DNA polymerase)
VKAAISAFPNGSAGGPDGLRPQHLKDMIAGKGQDEALLEAITDLVNVMLEGRIPESVRPVIFGGSLMANQKKGGGVRPIAVGYVWRRLAGKVACHLIAERSATLLSPRQLGFGVRGGAEAAVHATRRYLANLQPDQVFVKVDFANAFNTIRRDVILEAIARHVPELLNYACSSYGSSSELRFGERSVSSEEGAQQGDPLGPLYFCLAVHELLTSLKSELVTGYLDDISLGGEAGTVADDFIRLEAEAAKLGLKLNRSKCEVAGLSSMSRDVFSARGIVLAETSLSDISLLGSPLLPGAGIDSALAMKREELRTLAGRLPLMHAHDSLFLLRNVVSTPRLLYTLRTAPCTGNSELVRYDELLRSTLSVTLNIDLTDVGWRQASLPVRWGGLGVRSAVSLASSAYLASAAGTSELVNSLLPPHLHQAVDPSVAAAFKSWQSVVDPAALPPTSELAKRQRAWDESCCRWAALALLNSATDDYTRARLKASQHVTSGAWLEALPISSVGLRLGDGVVRVAVGIRLGLNLCEPHVCSCGTQVDARGIHGLACKRSAGRHPRHGLLNDVVWRAMHRAQVPSTKEPTGLSRSDGKRPDGATMIPWARGRCLTWDVTSPDTLARSHLQASAMNAGAAATRAEASKVAKYAAIATTHIFVPLAFETLGPWGEQAQSFVTELGRRISAVTGDTREIAYLKQRLSIAIQRGNALACLGTLGQFTVGD